MEEKTLQNLRERADAKLRFANIHLNELKALEYISGSDFERAHQEAFLYHLLSAKDAFLLELNVYYNVNLPEQNLTVKKLRKAISAKGKNSEELNELLKLENEADAWLNHAKAMRNHATHISDVPRSYYLGGERNRQVHLRNPKSGEIIERHFVDEFTDWLRNMEVLLERLRRSAIEKNVTKN
jgi:hypothetical protein